VALPPLPQLRILCTGRRDLPSVEPYTVPNTERYSVPNKETHEAPNGVQHDVPNAEQHDAPGAENFELPIAARHDLSSAHHHTSNATHAHPSNKPQRPCLTSLTDAVHPQSSGWSGLEVDDTAPAEKCELAEVMPSTCPNETAMASASSSGTGALVRTPDFALSWHAEMKRCCAASAPEVGICSWCASCYTCASVPCF